MTSEGSEENMTQFHNGGLRSRRYTKVQTYSITSHVSQYANIFFL